MADHCKGCGQPYPTDEYRALTEALAAIRKRREIPTELAIAAEMGRSFTLVRRIIAEAEIAGVIEIRRGPGGKRVPGGIWALARTAPVVTL